MLKIFVYYLIIYHVFAVANKRGMDIPTRVSKNPYLSLNSYMKSPSWGVKFLRKIKKKKILCLEKKVNRKQAQL